MLANADVNCHWPGAVLSQNSDMPCYFWRAADGNYDAGPLWNIANATTRKHHLLWQRGCSPGDAPILGCHWYLDCEEKYPPGLGEKVPWHKDLIHAWGHRIAWTNGNVWLVVEGVEPDKMAPQGLGFWTPLLGTAPARKTTVSLKMRGKDLAPTDKGSPAMWLQFTNETGQNRDASSSSARTTRARCTGRN